ncbi:MAG: hypothetical protein H7Y09_07750 [Chitinophagaceae bacterium]|nr:hypothetical protein [Anaerolineae bacterium]
MMQNLALPELFVWLMVGIAAAWAVGIIAQMENPRHLIIDGFIGTLVAYIAGSLFIQSDIFGMIGFNLWSVIVAFSSAFMVLAVLRVLQSILVAMLEIKGKTYGVIEPSAG